GGRARALRRGLHRPHPARGGQRDRGDERRMARGLRSRRRDPDDRQRLLAERRDRRLDRALRGTPPARRLNRGLGAQAMPSAARTSGAPSSPRNGPASSTGPIAKRVPGRRVRMSTAAPSAPPSSITPSSEASSTSPPSAPDMSTTTGSVFASPIPSSGGASSATTIAPTPSTAA